MDPSYRPSLLQKDGLGSGVLPFAGSDLVLSPSQWSSHVVGMNYLLLLTFSSFNYYEELCISIKKSILPSSLFIYWIESTIGLFVNFARLQV